MAVLGIAVLYGRTNLRKMESGRESGKNLMESVKHSNLKTADSYEEVYDYVSYRKHNGNGFFNFLTGDVKSDSADMAVQEEAKESSPLAGEMEYSKTNTREASVDEADIVKTDGRYIYTVTEELNKIGIADTKDGQLKEAVVLEVGECEFIHEIYIKGDRLIVLYRGVSGDMKTAVYDISDIENPKLLQDFMQSGDYFTSRLNGDYLYVFSKYYVHGECKKSRPEEYIPYVEDKMMPLEKIFLPDTDRANAYTVVTSVNVTSPDKITDTISILSNDSECYVSSENIYMCDRKYDGSEEMTEIRKISYSDGEMKGAAKAEVAGYLNDSFSIDEYDGYLRMVVTLSHANTNSVYILDEKLEMTGKIQGLAKGERVYSARFMGNVGYFVTFRETDPLFSVDLSDPENPEIIGSLKIPGFSEYLHPYGDGLLLGIGKEVDERAVTADEVKLSMFDISNPWNVKEIDKCIIKGAYDSQAFHSYKSVTIDAEKNVIGFSAYAESEKYYLYEYDRDRGFVCNMAEGILGGYPDARGIYIDDIFYLVKGSVIEAYNLQNFEKIDDIIL